MTQKKRWWIELSTTERKPGLFLFNEDGRMKIRGTRTGELYQPITDVEIYNDEKRYSQGVKISTYGNGTSRKACLDKACFDYSKSAFSKQFVNMDRAAFVEAVKRELQKMNGICDASRMPTTPSQVSPSTSSTTDVVPDAGHTSGTSNIADTNESDQTLDGKKCNSRSSKQSVKDITGLRSGSKDLTTEECHKALLKDTVIDTTVAVNLCQLTSGEEYLREVDDKWVNKLKASMSDNTLFKGVPLIAIVNVPKDQFDVSKPNAYRYVVIGGCHQLKAAQQLSAEKKIYNKTLDVQVYGEELLQHRETVSWWANKHNDLQKLHRNVKTQEKVKFCRTEFLRNDGDWKARCRSILELKGDYLSTTILLLAESSEAVYDLLLKVFNMYIMAELKGAKLTRTELAEGADCKPGHFSNFVQIVDEECKEDLLRELINREKTLKEFEAECLDIKRRQTAQEQFVLQTEAGSWKEAVNKYPLHTTVNAIDRFAGVNFKRATPEVWNNHISSAKKFKKGQDTDLPPQCYKEKEARGYLSCENVIQLTARSAQNQFSGFHGADLVILNLKEERITKENLQVLFGSLRSINLDLDKNQFLTCLFVNVEDVGNVVDLLKEDATHTEVCYINMTPGKLKSGKALLHSSVEPVVVVYWSSSRTMPSPLSSIVTRLPDMTNLFSGETFEEIMIQLLKAFSHESQWILAANLRTEATAVIAALSLQRNCIQLVDTDEEAKRAHGQLNNWEAEKRNVTSSSSASQKDKEEDEDEDGVYEYEEEEEEEADEEDARTGTMQSSMNTLYSLNDSTCLPLENGQQQSTEENSTGDDELVE